MKRKNHEGMDYNLVKAKNMKDLLKKADLKECIAVYSLTYPGMVSTNDDDKDIA